jgi:hypothetical protein
MGFCRNYCLRLEQFNGLTAVQISSVSVSWSLLAFMTFGIQYVTSVCSGEFVDKIRTVHFKTSSFSLLVLVFKHLFIIISENVTKLYQPFIAEVYVYT